MRLDEAYAALDIVEDFIPRGNSNRPGTPLAATSITIHNTDNTAPGADAAAHARYQKGPDAQIRKVSWHFTVDDRFVYQSLPTNEIGWHTARQEGNATSIGIEICMNEGLDQEAAYKRAALLAAIVARKERISLPGSIYQHHDWSGKNCPIVLRSTSDGWKNFVADVVKFANEVTDPNAAEIGTISDQSHNFPSGAAAVAEQAEGAAAATAAVNDLEQIAWGKSVSAQFKSKVMAICEDLGCDPSYLMAAMAFETGERFTSDVQNPRTDATGLIQFMPKTAEALGTSIQALAAMDALSQLDWVQKYLMPFHGRMKSLSDVYMTILFPKAVGKPDASILFASPSQEYEQNSGLDVNDDGTITKGEAASKVQAKLDLGLSDAHRG